MKQWFNKNYRTLIILSFLVPIIIVAVVSISHVTEWYGLSNPISWAVYLSVGIEIAALSALAAISANMGSKVYFPFIIVTLIQFIGNIFFSYTYINIDSEQFKDWVSLVSPLLELMGIEEDNFIGHKRFLSFFAGGMLPLISLTFLHMLVKFTEEDRVKDQKLVEDEQRDLIDNHVIEEHVNKALENYKKELEKEKIDASDIVSEVSRIRLSDEDLKVLETILMNPPEPNEKLKEAFKNYKDSNIVEQQTEEVEQPSDPIIEEKEEVVEESEESGSNDNLINNNTTIDTLDDHVVDTLETVTVDDEDLIDEVKEIENEVSEINEDTEKKNF
jgi:uncharacterized protein (DUF1778 family)